MKKHSSPPDATAERESVATIASMAAQGEGVAIIEGRKVYIPFTLPEETVRAQIKGARGELIAVDTPSPDRVHPVCRHFGICGGCSLQHWADAPYAAWKTALVAAALAREGLDAEIGHLRSYPVESRRRTGFTALRESETVRLGFRGARSHQLVDIAECPILVPKIASCLPSLKTALRRLLANGAEARVNVTQAANGLDCAIEAAKTKTPDREWLSQILRPCGFIRATLNRDTLFVEETPFVLAAGVKAALPHGAFLQAVDACERDMAAFAVEALQRAKAAKGPICDLFSGLGAFTFAAAKEAAVTSYESDTAAVSALNGAARGASGLKPVTGIRRDLFRNPLGTVELNAFAAAIADPPREGAEAQSRALAVSRLGTVVMLSCNPATFARDAAILVAGGFSLDRVAIFDQFKFSPHVEIAAAFSRARSKKGRLSPALRR